MNAIAVTYQDDDMPEPVVLGYIYDPMAPCSVIDKEELFNQYKESGDFPEEESEMFQAQEFCEWLKAAKGFEEIKVTEINFGR